MPSFIGDRFNDTALNKFACLIVVDDDMVLITRSLNLDYIVNAAELSQIDFAVDIKSPLVVFVRNPLLLTFIVVIP